VQNSDAHTHSSISGFFRVKANDLGYTADLERGVMVEFGGDVPGQVKGLAKVKGCAGPKVRAPVADVARPTFGDHQRSARAGIKFHPHGKVEELAN
jgi:hypothetical protein